MYSCKCSESDFHEKKCILEHAYDTFVFITFINATRSHNVA